MIRRQRKFFSFLFAVLFIFLLVSAQAESAQGEGSRGILYQVQNSDVTVYLLGSIHVGNDEMYPVGEAIEKAMEISDTFVFECDTTSKDATAAAQEMMYYSDGTRLRDVISPELYQKLLDVCKKTGQRIKTYERMRPWAAMTQLSLQATAAEMGVANVKKSTAMGVEAMVSAFAKHKQRNLAYLETTKGQLQAFDSMSLALQEHLLDESLTVILQPEAIQGMDATIRHWPTWWREGNAEAFVQSYQGQYLDPKMPAKNAGLLAEYHDILVTKRNRSMCDTIEGYLQQEGTHTYFVTVGLLHLVLPEDSIVRQLQESGYVVENLSE